MSQPGELGPALLRQIFDHRIRPRHIDNVPPAPASQSVLVILGGQPGAGKTRAAALSRSDHPGIVAVIGDDFRRYHPQYDTIMETEPLRMPDVTAQAAGAWVEMSLAYLQSERRSALLETTLRQPTVVEATVRQFHDAGYQTELRVLAVPEELSRMGTVTRYVGQVVEGGAGRWAPSTFHDAAYGNASESMACVVTAGLLDRVIVIDRHANVLADMAIDRTSSPRQLTDLQGVVAAGRDVTTITPTQGQRWITELIDNARHLTAWGESNPDILDTVRRLSEQVDAVAARAWPEDSARAALMSRGARDSVAALTRGNPSPLSPEPKQDRPPQRTNNTWIATPRPWHTRASDRGRWHSR